MSEPERIGVLFVCYANICRSPLAEGTFRWLAERGGVLDRLHIDSAGTSARVGALPHPLSREIASEQGFTLTGEARQLIRDDLARFDHVVVMDRQNLGTIQQLTGSRFGFSSPAGLRFGFSSPAGLRQSPQAGFRARVRLLREIADPKASSRDLDVPDPIGQGPEHYRAVFGMIERGCAALLAELR